EDSPALHQPYPLNVRALHKGFVVATPARNGAGQAFIDGVLQGAGLKEGTDYSVVVTGPQANSIAALAAKQVDAAVLVPPFTEQPISQGLAVPWVEQAKGQGPSDFQAAYGGTLNANAAWIAKNPDLAQKLVAGIIQADQFIRNPKNLAAVTQIDLK